jgi:hypothetical protein
MPNYQTNNNILVAIQRETVQGVPATPGAGSAAQLRITDSPGLDPDRALIQSAEKRTDGTKAMPRLGGLDVPGTYNGEVTVGGALDILWESIMRGTWSASFTVTATGAGAFVNLQASSTSVLTRTGTGSFITDGFKVGDIIRCTNLANAANNNKNFRVTAVTALTMSLAGSPLIADAVSTTATVTRTKKVINPAAGPTRYTHTVEEFNAISDLSRIGVGMRLVGFNLSFKPKSMATFSAVFEGINVQYLVNGTSPYFITPTVTSGLALIADDSVIRYNGVDVVHFTGFDLNFTIEQESDATIGSLTKPDIADGDFSVTGTITALNYDFSNFTIFNGETEVEMSILLQEPGTAPLNFVAINVPRAKLSKVALPAGGGGGFKKETLNVVSASRASAATYDATVAAIYSSAP